MIEDLEKIFGKDAPHCIVETNKAQIEIYDCYDCSPAEQRSYIRVDEQQPVHFTLQNPALVPLTFAALDNCLLRSADHTRCDFLIGNKQKIYFVEVKQVSIKQRSAAKADAIKQLDASISLIKPHFPDTHKVAVICLKAKQVHPLQSAKRVADIVAFKERHQADLMEGQTHVF